MQNLIQTYCSCNSANYLGVPRSQMEEHTRTTHSSSPTSTTALFQAGNYSAGSTYLHLVIDADASSHNVILSLVWELLHCTMYKIIHTCNTETLLWLVCSVSTCCILCPARHYSTWSQPVPGSHGTVAFLLTPHHH